MALLSAYSVRKASEWLLEVCRHHRYAACSSRTCKAKVNLEQMLSSCCVINIRADPIGISLTASKCHSLKLGSRKWPEIKEIISQLLTDMLEQVTGGSQWWRAAALISLWSRCLMLERI